MPEATSPKKKVNRNYYLVGGIVVGLVVYLWWRHRQQQAAAAQMIGSTLPGSMPTGAGDSTTAFPGGGTPGTQTYTDITAWAAAVQKWANSLGFDAAETQNALANLVTGTCLSPSQYKIIDQALSVFGQPPGTPVAIALCSDTGGGTGGTGGGGATPPPVDVPPPAPPPPPVPLPPPPPQPINPPAPPAPSAPPTPTNPWDAIVQFFTGSGYGPNNTTFIPSIDNFMYEWIPDAAAFNALPAGTTTYYQPVTGTFVATQPNMGLQPGTPQFVRVHPGFTGTVQPH